MSEFKSFLYYTNGAILFHYWMDAEHLKHHLNPHTANSPNGLWSISSVFRLVTYVFVIIQIVEPVKAFKSHCMFYLYSVQILFLALLYTN